MAQQQAHPHAPTKRMTDRLEDLAACLLALVGTVGAVLVLILAGQVQTAQAEKARFEASTRTPVTAVALRDAVATVSGRAGENSTIDVPVRWTGRDGTERTGTAAVAPPMRVGQAVTVWVDHDQRSVPAPLSPDDATVGAFLVGSFGTLALISALAVAWTGVRRWTLALNCARWEREWSQVEPVWSGRARGESRS